MSIDAGKLSSRIWILAPTKVRDELNQPLPDAYDPLMRLWAQPAGASGMASIMQSRTEDGVPRELNSYSFRIRYRPHGITSDMRVLDTDTNMLFNIKQIRHDLARRQWTDLVCETVT